MSDAMLYTPHGCVLYLDLRKVDGNKVYDYSGHGNHGTIYGARLNQELPCRGLEFDGEDDYVKASPYPSLSALTVEVVYYTPFRLGDVSGIVQHVFHGELNKPFIKFDDRADHQRFEIFLNTVGGGDTLYAPCVVERGWHVLHFTYNGSLMELYLDGVLIDSKEHAYGGDVSAPSKVLLATYREDGGFSKLTMTLTRIYNRALSSDEVKKCFEDIQKRILRRIVAARDVSVR